MLPPLAYTSEDVFAWEQRHSILGGWSCVGRAAEVGAPGDQRAISVGRSGVLVIRGSDGRLRAFANTCRHRGHELLACGEQCNRAIVVCPYHAWSYRLDGTLRSRRGEELRGEDATVIASGDAAVGRGAATHLERAELGLTELGCAEWNGFVFVDVGGTAPPFAEHVAGLDQIVAPYEIGRLVVGASHRYVVEANWKILNENYQECYHCPLIHPELCRVSPPESGENYVHPMEGAWVGGWQDLAPGAETMSLDGSTKAAPLRGLDARRRRIIDYVGIFPNLLVSMHPDFVMTHLMTPLGATTTEVECAWLFAPEEVDREGFDPDFAVEFWDLTNRQDWRACESVQRGLASPRSAPGPFSSVEDAVYQFVTMVARGYTGLPLRTEPIAVH